MNLGSVGLANDVVKSAVHISALRHVDNDPFNRGLRKSFEAVCEGVSKNSKCDFSNPRVFVKRFHEDADSFTVSNILCTY